VQVLKAEKNIMPWVFPSKIDIRPTDKIPLLRTGPVDILIEQRRNNLGELAPLYAFVTQISVVSGGKKSKLALKDPEQERTQIFIRTLSGNTICKQI